MKTSILIVGALGAVGILAQTLPSNLPSCSVDCANYILGNATGYGCTSGDYKCLCANQTFGYAIHDCNAQHCQNDTAANIGIAWGNELCQNVSEPINLPSANVPVGPATASGSVASGASTAASSATTPTGSGTGTGAPPTAITTSTFTDTLTSNGAVMTTTGATTISGAGSESNTGTSGASMTSPTMTSATTSGTAGSATSGASAAGATSTSQGGAAPKQTAGPVAGVLFAAGLAAALL